MAPKRHPSMSKSNAEGAGGCGHLHSVHLLPPRGDSAKAGGVYMYSMGYVCTCKYVYRMYQM